MAQMLLDRLRERFGDAVITTSTFRGDEVAVVKRERIIEILTYLKSDPDCLLDFCRDLTVIDWLGEERARFEVVYQLYSIEKKHSVRLKCPLNEEDAVIDSCVSLYPGMNWFEREAWDMYGVKFAGHPDLRRMFMYEEFVGHALRKDYPKEKRQPLIRREGMT